MHGPSLYETLDTGFATKWHNAVDVTQQEPNVNVPSLYETLDTGFATKWHYTIDLTQKVPLMQIPI